MPETKEASSSRASILIAIIGVIGSLGVAAITRATLKTDIKESRSDIEVRFKNLRGIQVQSGFVEGINSLPGWTLDRAPSKSNLRETTPPRIYVKRVEFAEGFSAQPTVLVGIRALDGSRDANTRIIVSATNIDSRGFEMRFQTWSDSRIFNIIVDWIAYQQ